ncbi:MAG TPA: hypothetical protein VHU13_06035 [Solirubrobacteraceae bacterium]|nr:hypothetical protein [Solirubrobacteraceae bacterium]
MAPSASIAHARRGKEESPLRLHAARPWTVALAPAAVLALVCLIASPPAGDLAAATYRSDLFARVGFSSWDTGWYAAHGYWLASYSLLSPGLGALLGVRLLLALSALAASVLFALIVERVLPRGAARASAVVFALAVSVGMLSGRVPFDLGAAIALAAVLALLEEHVAIALALAAACGATSPVAGTFLALAGAAGAAGAWWTGATSDRRESPRAHARPAAAGAAAAGAMRATDDRSTAGALWCTALTAAALAPVLILSLAYPNGGYEPFVASAFWPQLAAAALIALLLPRGPLSKRAHASLRAGAALYALALTAAYAIHTPMGGNAARLGPLLGPALLVGVLWPAAFAPTATAPPPSRRRHARALLAGLVLPLLYWQLATPIKDYVAIAGDPAVKASYYAPLLAELRRLTLGRPTIVEVPLTKAHWESAYLPWHDGVRLARGWERQLDTRYAALFYRPTLTAAAYRAWLASNRVRYVALPDAKLDSAGAREGALIARGVPYLRESWRSAHWRLYRFEG